MANLLGQIVVPAGQKVAFSTGLQNNDQEGVFSVYFQQMIIQNNGANSARIGDVTVSSSRGIELAAAGSVNAGALINYGSYVNDWYAYSDTGTTIDFLYIK